MISYLSDSEISISQSQNTILIQETEKRISKREKKTNRIFLNNSILNILLNYKYFNINILEILFLIIFNVLYIMSLKTCNLSSNKCLVKYRFQMGLFTLYSFMSTFIFFLYIIYHLKKKQFLNFLLWIFNLSIFYLFFTGYQWSNHGSFNSLLSFSILSLLIFVLMIFLTFQKIYNFHKKLFLFCIFTFISLIFGIIVLRFILTEPLLWKGYKNTKMENTGKLCRYKNFYLNWHEGTKYFLLFLPKLLSESEKSYNPLWKNDNFSVYEYPDTRKFDLTTRSYVNVLAKKIQENIKGIPNDQIPQSEAWVDFRNKEPKINIKITKNTELIKKRKELLIKNNLINKYKGLYILFIDGLSRANFPRLYNKNFQYLEKYYDNKNSKYEVFQFFRVHSIKPYTSPNVGTWRFGDKDYDNNKRKINPKLINIEGELANKGFITAHSNGFCNTKINEYFFGEAIEKNIIPNKWDHEFISPGCDEEIYSYEYPFSPFKGPYSLVRRKIFNQDFSSLMMEYIEKFHSTYKDEKTISSIMLSDNHELSRDVPLYIQDRLKNHFEKIIEENILNGKSLIFLADHGQHMTPFLRDTPSGNMEQYSPILNLIIPRDIADKYRNILKKNEQKVIGMMDIRKVMFFLASGEDKGDGINFVKDVIKEDRNPGDVGVKKPEWECIPPQ